MLLTLASAVAQSSATNYSFTHLAGPGGGPGSTDGTGPTARFTNPNGVAADRSGNLYVADTNNHTIRKIAPGGLVSTLAGSAGVIGSADGTGAAAQFFYPSGVATDPAGNVYVADRYNHTIRKITPAGVVTTLAGTAGISGSADGTGTAAQFSHPKGVAVDNAGNLYVADSGNGTIRLITSAGVVTTFAGTAGVSGSDDGTGSAAKFSGPNGVAVDARGNVYVADQHNNTIRQISPAGIVTTLAGTAGNYGPAKDGTGAAAVFFYPGGLAVDALGNVYVADGCYANALDYGFTNISDFGEFVPNGANHTIRKIAPGGIVTTLAGASGQPGSADGTGPAAQFKSPQGLTVDLTGNVCVADSWNHSIRQITPAGIVTTLAGTAGISGSADGATAAARFNFPMGVAVDGAGNAYVADAVNCTIRKITPAGIVTTLAGTVGVAGQVDGTGPAARFNFPTRVAVDGAGNVYVSDTGNRAVRKITPAGAVTTLAVPPGSLQNVGGIAVDGTGNVYVTDFWADTVHKITPAGAVSALTGSSGLGLFHPTDIALDGAGNSYVTETGGYYESIKKITPAGVVTNLLDPAVAASLDYLRGTRLTSVYGLRAGYYLLNGASGGIAADRSGNVYVADYWFHTIKKITPDGAVIAVAGLLGVRGSADGIGPDAQFNYPGGMAVDNAGHLYVADTGNNAIRQGQPAGPPVITAQPLSQNVTLGASVQLSVTAAATPAPTYQWYFNHTAFNGAVTSVLSFTGARSADAGDYTVVVTNALGAVTSAQATLTVSAAANAPETPPASGGSGGGSIDRWFVLVLVILGGAGRRWTRPRSGQKLPATIKTRIIGI